MKCNFKNCQKQIVEMNVAENMSKSFKFAFTLTFQIVATYTLVKVCLTVCNSTSRGEQGNIKRIIIPCSIFASLFTSKNTTVNCFNEQFL